ncbi:hypothetical protein HPB47_002806 [Ixodes persulcatus]|uniref:Uncharacterized protein n=1 Tax=Ixodes persulcatus TaxID=34615 RepID=A0AC60R2J1_IXOPE|nr:hypothetical protein HPB47_002806 [Ixodes persulcatus]
MIGMTEQILERKIRIQRNLDQNLITIQTDKECLARKMDEMKQIIQGRRQYNTVSYPAMPEGSIRGLIHEVEENTDPARLKVSIYVEDGTEIISTHMRGKSNSAIITFNGNRLPRYVIYRETRMRCYLYRPHMHACTVCLKPGNRDNVCPTPGAKQWRMLPQDHQPARHHLLSHKSLTSNGRRIVMSGQGAVSVSTPAGQVLRESGRFGAMLEFGMAQEDGPHNQECHGKGKFKRSLNSGRPVFSEEIDDGLFEFLQEERAAGRAVSNRLLQEQAWKLASEAKVGNFNASSQYLSR